MSDSDSRPMFSQVGRARGTVQSRGSRFFLLLVALGLTVAVLAQLWVIEGRARVNTVRVWLSVTPETEAAAERAEAERAEAERAEAPPTSPPPAP